MISLVDNLIASGTAELTFQNYPDLNGWIYKTGAGPTLMNKIYSVAVTGFQFTVGTLYPYQYKESLNPAVQYMQKRVANRGLQLGGNDVYEFIQGVSKKNPINQISAFYFQKGVSIHDFTLEEIKTIINETSADFDLSLPICIPINFGSYAVFERNHVASIIIKDNVVDYYDSKGVFSKYKNIKEGCTLRDTLEYCRDKFTKNGNIVENPYIHQYDVHNCGVFVCYHIHSKITLSQLIGTLKINEPSLDEIQHFREVINQIAYGDKDFSIQTEIYSSSLGDDFDLSKSDVIPS